MSQKVDKLSEEDRAFANQIHELIEISFRICVKDTTSALSQCVSL